MPNQKRNVYTFEYRMINILKFTRSDCLRTSDYYGVEFYVLLLI